MGPSKSSWIDGGSNWRIPTVRNRGGFLDLGMCTWHGYGYGFESLCTPLVRHRGGVSNLCCAVLCCVCAEKCVGQSKSYL